MKSTDSRALFNVLIASGAGLGNVVTVPDVQDNAGNGKASLTLGFPPETFISRSAGGIPPRGQDMNGFLQRLSKAIQVVQTGYFGKFDADFASDIGGYPAGAVVCGNVAGTFWVSLSEDNVTVPDADGASWQSLFRGYASESWVDNNYINGTPASGTDNKLISNMQLIYYDGADSANTYVQVATESGAIALPSNANVARQIVAYVNPRVPSSGTIENGYYLRSAGMLELAYTIDLTVKGGQFYTFPIAFSATPVVLAGGYGQSDSQTDTDYYVWGVTPAGFYFRPRNNIGKFQIIAKGPA